MNEFAHIRLEDLTVIKTLGVGGFGRVELVNMFTIHNDNHKRGWCHNILLLNTYIPKIELHANFMLLLCFKNLRKCTRHAHAKTLAGKMASCTTRTFDAFFGSQFLN